MAEVVEFWSSGLQKVQLQLKKGEAASKSDQSPVTIADYGIRAFLLPSSCLRSNLCFQHLLTVWSSYSSWKHGVPMKPHLRIHFQLCDERLAQLHKRLWPGAC